MTQISNEQLADRLFYRVNNPSAWPHGFDEAASELFREAAAALRASSGVEVKGLEWGKTSYGRPEVDTIVGVYRVFEHMSGGWAATFKTFNLVDPHGRKNFATEAEAVAAVEADYRQRILSCLSSPLPTVEVTATHRHKKRGTEYVLIGIGKIQAEDWEERNYAARGGEDSHRPLDMREVAIYCSATDPNEMWVRPREEFEDGRFEALSQNKGE
jgi:hypothetical protein